MKRKHLIGIFILLIILAGAYILSPFSPMNKVSVNGETIKLSSGYTVEESTEKIMTISNKTNQINITAESQTENMDDVITQHKNMLENYTFSQTPLTVGKKNVTKLEATNTDTVITNYYFEHKNVIYNIETKNADNNTENVIKDLISSI